MMVADQRSAVIKVDDNTASKSTMEIYIERLNLAFLI
jgi:hypothetical protein